MDTGTSSAFRLKYRRRGWSASRMKASDVYVSMRRAVSQAHKLVHATERYELEPIEELYIERGTVLWDRQQLPVSGIDLTKQPEPAPYGAVVAKREKRSLTWTDLFWDEYGRGDEGDEMAAFIEMYNARKENS